MRQSSLRLFRWVEARMKTDLTYLTKGGFWLTAGYVSQIASSLLLTVAFANFIDKESYGTYQFVMSSAAIISAFTLSGMAVAIKRSVAQGNEGALRYGFRTKLIWSGAIVLISGCIAAFYFFTGNTVLGKAFIIVGLFGPFLESFSLYKAYLTGTQRFKESTLLGFWRKPLVVVSVLVALGLTNDPLIILFTYFCANTISVASLYYLVVKKYELPVGKDASLLNYSKHLSLLGIAGSIGNNADKIFIFLLLGPQAVAVYMFAILPATHLLKLFGFISSDLIFPKFVKQSFETIAKNIYRKIFIFFIIVSFCVLTYLVSAKFLFSTLFPAYPEAIILSQIAMLALFTKPNTLLGLVFTTHGYKKLQYISTISSHLVKILLLVILIPLYGVLGAVWTFVATHVFWSILVWCLFYYQKIKSERIYSKSIDLERVEVEG